MPPERDLDLRTLLRLLRIPLSLLLLVIVGGTVGFYVEWRAVGGNWLDALYMTFITITTVGYSEIHPLDSSGRVLAIAVSLAGIGSLFYLLTTIMDYLVRRELRDPYGRNRMQKQIDRLSGHVIIVGFGRMGSRTAEELAAEEIPFVVIDKDPTVEPNAVELGYPYLIGDAEEEEVLERAGIRRARGVIIATASDATNAFVALSARALNRNVYIVARADSPAAVRKLQRAGANRAIDLYSLAGQRLANSVVRPATVDFLAATLGRSTKELGIHEVRVDDGSAFVGRSLRELNLRQRTGASVLAILRDQESIPNPPPDFELKSGDHLIALGTREQLAKLAELAASRQEQAEKTG